MRGQGEDTASAARTNVLLLRISGPGSGPQNDESFLVSMWLEFIPAAMRAQAMLLCASLRGPECAPYAF